MINKEETITQVHNTTPNRLIDALDERFESRFNELERKLALKEVYSKWLTRYEVSKMLSVSLVTLNSWAKADVLPIYKIGNQVRYKAKDVENALIKIE